MSIVNNQLLIIFGKKKNDYLFQYFCLKCYQILHPYEPLKMIFIFQKQLFIFLQVMSSSGLANSSHSSEKSSVGGTPPLTSLSFTSPRCQGSGSPNTNPKTSRSVSPSNRSGSKYSDDSMSSKNHRAKKKSSKSSLNGATPDTSMDTNSSVFSPPSQTTSPNVRKISKNSNYPSTSSFASYTSTERKKKKSWMSNAISRTYRQRCEEVRKNFPALPANEMLIGDYSCALQKDILVHGRIYITTNYLCFYANIFRWETAVSIPWKEVKNIMKL